MPLLNEFCFVEEQSRTDNTFKCQLRFDAAHTIFQGHFPGKPVVPGVCSIEIVRELMGMIFQKNIQLKKSANTKFLRLLTPEDAPVAELSWKEENGEIVVQASMIVDEKNAFKMQGVMVIV
jgi:3-hydroxyacyl-[acyl-carrier-protein] dehydratase